MTDTAIPPLGAAEPVPPARIPSPAEVRAERRRLIESVRALRPLLHKRRSFELADQRRLSREARERDRADTSHGKALHRIHEQAARRTKALTLQLNGLHGKQHSQEERALTMLRRESVKHALRSTYITASEVNGIGKGLVRDLAAHSIRTAADFKRVSWGHAPNGKGGQVLYIHLTQGGKVHINGIGEHRGRPLMEWRRAAVVRAEARAPRVLPPDERHRIREISEAEWNRLQNELAEVPTVAATEREEAAHLYAAALHRLVTARHKAANTATELRAEFDAMAEQLRLAQAQLSAHIHQYGDAGLRLRRAQGRALRPAPATSTPASHTSTPPMPISGQAGKMRPPVDLTKATAENEQRPTPGVRAGLVWLVPLVFFSLTVLLGAGEPEDGSAPLWFIIGGRLMALALVVDLLRLWIPRRRWKTAAPMPRGTGLLCTATLLALAATGMFADPHYATGGAPWATAGASLLCCVLGVARRRGRGLPNAAPR